MREGQFAGFFTHWTFDRFVYGEHFAVDSALRGQNLGTETIQAFLALHTLPVVLEVEMPDEPDAIRRIHFTNATASKVVQHPYAQPLLRRLGTHVAHAHHDQRHALRQQKLPC